MNHDTKSAPILINNPLTLLYWIFFRALALRRYANSIHEGLDENLLVWEVRKEVADDSRFQPLCRARWWLLATAPITAVLLWEGISNLFGLSFNWSRGLLYVLGYTAGTFLSDALY